MGLNDFSLPLDDFSLPLDLDLGLDLAVRLDLDLILMLTSVLITVSVENSQLIVVYCAIIIFMAATISVNSSAVTIFDRMGLGCLS